MHLKNFFADTLPEAIELVRQHLGEDAVILSSEPDPDTGGVCVTAALEPGGAPEVGIFETAEGMEAFHRLSAALEYHRVPDELFERLLDRAGGIATTDLIEALVAALESELPFTRIPEAPSEQPLLLMGPPGAGKTATAAKLAAQIRVRGGKTTLITLDTGKAGGLAQISAFADALGATLREANDAASLRRAVKACPKGHFVVVDAIGASPFDLDAMRELQDWLDAAGADGVLVMQASSDSLEAAETAAAYAEIGASAFIPTKLDACRRVGSILSAADHGHLSLMAVGTAPTIGGGLRGISPAQLARLILPDEGDEAVEFSPSFAIGAGA